MNTNFISKIPNEWLRIANVFSALGDPTRQKILLAFEPGEIIPRRKLLDAFHLSASAMSYHLNTLINAGLLLQEKKGREIFLRPDIDFLIENLSIVQTYAQNLRDAMRYKTEED